MASNDQSAGLDSSWKNAGLKLWLRLDGDPTGGGSAVRRPSTALAPFLLPEDLGADEIARSGHGDSFAWTANLERDHKTAVQRVVSASQWAAHRRAELMKATSERARSSCKTELRRSQFSDLLAELAAPRSLKLGGTLGAASSTAPAATAERARDSSSRGSAGPTTAGAAAAAPTPGGTPGAVALGGALEKSGARGLAPHYSALLEYNRSAFGPATVLPLISALGGGGSCCF